MASEMTKMNLNELKWEIENAKWFSQLGNYIAPEGQLALLHLHAWDYASFDPAIDEWHKRIAREMDWLPSTSAEEDPIHGKRLTEYLKESGTDCQATRMDIYKLALKSLRSTHGMKIASGPHDYLVAAVGSALFCVRMATLEVLANCAGFWCELLKIYRNGNLPWGLMPDKTLVVY